MTEEQFKELKKAFLKQQLEGKKYDKDNGRLLPKDYSDKDKKLPILTVKDIEEFDDDNKIQIAICRAYEDSQLRTIKGNTSEGLFDWKNAENAENAMRYLKNQVKSFLERKNENTYDEWHRDTCEDFINKYNDYLSKKINNFNDEQEIGKAQKIVNMTMKYLYCMYDKNLDKFEHCHIALDHYTLENWFCREVKGKGQPTKEQIGKWSKINEYGDSNNGEYEAGSYMWIQNKIRNYLTINGCKYLKRNECEYKIMTPLQAEFIIWEEEKIRETLNNVKKIKLLSIDTHGENEKVTDDEFNNLITQTRNKLNEVEAWYSKIK